MFSITIDGHKIWRRVYGIKVVYGEDGIKAVLFEGIKSTGGGWGLLEGIKAVRRGGWGRG